MGLVLAGGLLAAVVSAGGVQAAEPNSSACDAFVGAWEYLPPSAPGHSVIGKAGSKYVDVFYNTVPASDAPKIAPSTDAGKAILYSRGGAGAFEYTCEASAGKLRLKARWLFSSFSPELVGSRSSLSRLSKTATKPSGGRSDQMASVEQWAQAGSLSRSSPAGARFPFCPPTCITPVSVAACRRGIEGEGHSC